MADFEKNSLKTQRFEARISSEQKKLFQRAAKLSGRSLTSFAIMAIQEAAMKVLREHTVIKLSTEDQVAFAKALLNPPKPSKKLTEAAKFHQKNVISE